MRGYEGCARRWLKLGRTRQRVWAIVGAKVGLWRCARPRRWRRGESLHHAAHVTKVRPHNLALKEPQSKPSHQDTPPFTLVLLLPMKQEHLHLAMVHSLYSSLSQLDSTNGCSCCKVSPSLAGWMTNDNPSLHHAMFGHSNIYVCS
ncbi:hypothetical protein ZEAMMB73_Zm00001d032960 [Zea mays]|uniref:Uncharacterized protein n=1 Tax=Zea mays TaxID=4577 RepID=A0A1D6KV43_MAIZE|nr:hypothetical protein ZEAMMB73_Zm00001d032960 [Zea mays]